MTVPESGSIRLGELAEVLGGRLEGDPDVLITGAAGLEGAEAGDILRVERDRYLPAAEASPAAALVVGEDLGPVRKPCIRVKDVRYAFALCLQRFAPVERVEPGVHPKADVHPETSLPADCSVGAFAVVGRGVRVGRGVVLHPHAVIGDEVELGEETVVYPHAVLYPRSVTGSRVRIHAGAVIGAPGYGYHWTGSRHHPIPQIGRVRLSDDVEVGACTTIDCATTGETVIGPGTKIDNLVQIGHNVRTGAHCLIISQVGIAGSTTLGNGVVLAGQAGVRDHVTIGDGAQIAAASGVWGSVDAGQVMVGYPARPRGEYGRIQAALTRLPDLLKRVKELEQLVAELREAAEN